MNKSFDLVVVGAGPAGCAAAIAARRNHKTVLLLERGSFPRMKVCGEFVSAEAVGRLRQLLRPSGQELLVELSPVIERTRIFLRGETISTRIDPPARSIPRLQMDGALWGAAKHSGAACREKCEVKSVPGLEPFRILTDAGEVQARLVVDASGRWSRLRSEEHSAQSGAKWLGIKQHFETGDPTDSVDLYFFAGGYCGIQPVDDKGTVNACAMVRSDVATCLEEVFDQQPELRRRSQNWKPTGEDVSTSPLQFRPPAPVSNGILRAGDAAGFIDPFAGDGISIALQSGYAAGENAAGSETASEAAERYRKHYNERFVPAFRAAERLRKMLELPAPALWAALKLMRLPGVPERAIRATRARA